MKPRANLSGHTVLHIHRKDMQILDMSKDTDILVFEDLCARSR